ncbi:MAG: metallophosphoesterase [Rhizobacter sp.]|nr:metallophosphoesterase [Bacteriovorax sp.]
MIRLILILAALLLYTCFKAIQLSPLQPYLMISLTIVFFISMVSSMFFSRTKPESFDTPWFIMLTWTGSMFMGFWGSFVMISIPLDIINVVWTLFNHGNSLFTQIIWMTVFAVSILITLIGLVQVLLGPKVKNINIPVENLPGELNGLKIAQISDLHIGPTIQTRYVEKVVKKTNATKPDLIVITGDLADAHTESIKKHLQPLRHLTSRFGTFYVTGNHEYYWGVETLLPELKALGMKILMSSNIVIDVDGAKLLVAGLPDPTGRSFASDHKPDIVKARTSEIKTQFNILLAHRPDPYEAAEKYGFHLQFSGHTHAGQFFPFSLLIPIAHKYYKGLNRHGKLWLYVNPGTGYWGPANRFGIASEITLAKLTKI